MVKWRTIVIAFTVATILSGGLLFTSNAHAQPACPTPITADTNLTGDCTGNIEITADNVTLNCGGHAVIGTGPGSGSGILLNGRSGVTVSECKVTNFDHGFNISSSDRNLFIKNSASNTFDQGFVLHTGADDNVLFKNTANNNSVRGFVIFGPSAGNILTKNTANDNQEGFVVFIGAEGNVLTGNRADSNSSIGFAVTAAAERNVLIGNTANFNGPFNGEGFVTEASILNTFINNKACNNTNFDGLQASGDGNVFLDNDFCTTAGIP